MQYDPVNGPTIAELWRVPASTLARWRRTGIIPDCRALAEPLDRKASQTEEKLITLLESGWLKGRVLSRVILTENKVNQLLATRRNPDDYYYSVPHLSGNEIRKIEPILNALRRELGTLLYLASTTPPDQNYSQELQGDLRAFLGHNVISRGNIRSGMDSQQQARFKSFLRGRTAKRNDVKTVLSRLELLAVLLA